MPTRRPAKRQRRLLTSTVDAFEPIKADERGFALIMVAVILALMLAFSIILVDNSLNSRAVGKYFQDTLTSEQLAEAGVHKALFCLKQTVGTNCGGTYGTGYTGESNVSFGTGTFTTTVSGSSTTKTVISTGTTQSGQTKRVAVNFTTEPSGTAINFVAALQADAGGVVELNNAEVYASDVLTIGDVSCSNGATIQGNVSVTRSGGKIDHCNVTQNAYADIVTSDNVTKDAYYKTDPSGIAGSSVGGTKHPNSATPAPQPLPYIDLAYWEGLAMAGTTVTGDYQVPAGASIGPLYVTGNLTTVSTGASISLNGPVYVKGTIDLSNNVVLNSSFINASSIVIADGAISVHNNGDLNGDGQTGSYVILVSNSTNSTDQNPAISISNNTHGAILYAPNGEVYVKNNGSAPLVAGYKAKLDQNCSLNGSLADAYLTPLNIAAAGNTTGFHLQSGTWREYK